MLGGTTRPDVAAGGWLWRGAGALGLVLALGCYTGAEPGDASFASGAEADDDAPSGDDDDDDVPSPADDDDDDGLPPVPGETIRFVGLDTPSDTFDEHCVDADGFDLRAVSPEGDAWIGRDIGGVTELQSVSPGGESRAWTLPWLVEHVGAWTADRATLAGGDTLWIFDDGDLLDVRWLEDSDGPEGFCGDPSVEGDGLVLAADVFSRDLGTWWKWNLPGAPLIDSDSFATVAGACTGASGGAWLQRGDAVWQISPEWAGPVDVLAPSSGLAFDDAFGVASVVGDDVVRLDDVDAAPEPIRFEAGAVHAIAGAPGVLWVAATDRLYRLRDGDFTETRTDDGAVQADTLWADAAGGLWIEREDAICRLRPQGLPILRIEGVRPYERRRTDSLTTLLHIDGGPSAAASVWLDGELLPTIAHEDGVLEPMAPPLDEGWHALEVRVDGEPLREIPFAVESASGPNWEEDIVPIFEEHCAGEACHGPDPAAASQPDLSSYDGWASLSNAIEGRVLDAGDMPPPGARKESWGVDEVLTIVGWLDAGLPQEDDQ